MTSLYRIHPQPSFNFGGLVIDNFAGGGASRPDYPPTGVRLARKLSPSLRSNHRPQAQLVVGYPCLFTRSSEVASSARTRPAVSVLQRPFNPTFVRRQSSDQRKISGYIRLSIEVPAVQPLRAVACELSSCTDSNKVREIGSTEGGYGQLICSLLVCIRISHPASASPVIYIGCRVGFFRDAFKHPLDTEEVVLNPQRQEAGRVVNIAFGFLSARILMEQRNHPSSENSCNRTYCLHPSRSTLCTPREIERSKQRKYGEWRYQQQLGMDGEPHFYFVGQHAPLLGCNTAESLPAPCHYVQRGAA